MKLIKRWCSMEDGRLDSMLEEFRKEILKTMQRILNVS